MDADTLRQLIENARAALRVDDLASARRWAEQAARLAPETEEPWLILTAASDPQSALQHARRALAVNPNSERARKALEWAQKRLPQDEAPRIETRPVAAPASPIASLPRASAPPERAAPAAELPPSPKKTNPRGLACLVLLAGFACIAIAIVAGWSAFRNPVMASILSVPREASATVTTEAQHSAGSDIELPSATPSSTFTPSVTPTVTFTQTPQPTFTSTHTFTPEFTSTPLPTDTPAPTETPGQMEAVIVEDTPTSIPPPTKAYVAPTQQASSGASVSYGARWIDVNLSQQMVYAYEGDVAVNSFLTSTGTWQYPTVTGKYKVYVKYISTRMTGPGYDLPNVPYVMYFYKGYGIHGTYWHNNFGTPMSHGCVNLSIPDAEWLYYWASVGTVVNVHY